MQYSLPDSTKDWLLRHPIPTVRYQALLFVEGLDENDRSVIKVRSEIMTDGPVAKILDEQERGGHWGEEKDFYQNSKYKGTVWNILAMAELSADGKDERIRAACEFILEASQVRKSGGFAYKGARCSGGLERKELSCLTSNLIWSLCKFGMEHDERVQKGVNWIVENQRFSLNPLEEMIPPFDHSRCWAHRECRSSAVKSLRALCAIPRTNRTDEVKKSIEKGRIFVQKTCLGIGIDGLHPLIRKEWMDLGCPNMWNTDLLEIASVLKAAGSTHDELGEVELALIEQMDKEKRLVQRSPFTKRLITKIEKFGEPSGLLTLRAFHLFNYRN